MLRDVGLAEELAQDALVVALERWPTSGIPDNPGAWLMAAAKHRALDRLRRRKLLERKHEQLMLDMQIEQDLADSAFPGDGIDADDAQIDDDLLRLMFVACHPVLSPEARVALTLRLLGGLATDEIARAFLVPEPTVAQRIVRAKRTLAEAHVPFEVPRREDLPARLSSVLEVLYLIFNEGYAATAGDDWMRPTLCDEALRLGRVLAELVSAEAEVHGLVALMEIQASRAAARVGPSGEPILLLEQNRGRWDPLLIRRGLAAIDRADALGGARGNYALQAAISTLVMRRHALRKTPIGRASRHYMKRLPRSRPRRWWNSIGRLPSRWRSARRLALSWSMRSRRSRRSPAIICCPPRAAISLAKLGRFDEARGEFERAASLTRNTRERRLLLEPRSGLHPGIGVATSALNGVSRRLCRRQINAARRRRLGYTANPSFQVPGFAMNNASLA